MNKIIILILLLSNISFSIDIYSGKKEISNIKKELILRYKKELDIDFRDFTKNTKDELRIFNETCYLQFLSKYIDIKDVKIYKSDSFENILIFSDEDISDELFDELFNIFQSISKTKVKLIQVPKDKNSKIIKEQSERRQND